MNRYITILLAAIGLCNTTIAQDNAPSVLGAKVNIQSFEYKSDSVKLNIEYDLEDLKAGPTQSVVLTPQIIKNDNILELDPIVIERRGGARSHNRATALKNRKSLKMYDELYGSPYKIVDYYGRQKSTKEQYSTTIPYQTWMVDSHLAVDCATCGCCSLDDQGSITPQDNILKINIPHIEEFQLSPKVELIKPEKVAVKKRDIEYSSALIFRVNSTYIDPNLERNRDELESIDEMMQSVISDNDYTITKVNIIGFASPEGSLTSNMSLSKGRAAALESHMKRKYKMIDPTLYNVEFGGENWTKLFDIVEHSDIAHRDEVMNIIKNIPIEDGRESLLMALNNGDTYKYLLKNIFPSTRLVLINVEFNIDDYNIDQIKQMITTKPQNLSLEEMYRLSESYNIDEEEFAKIFLTAAEVYPNDEIAQNNALATELQRGNIASIEKLASHVNKETTSAELANSLGAYYMMKGDYQNAQTMLQRAEKLGSKQASANLVQIAQKQANIQRIDANNALKAKIYGK